MQALPSASPPPAGGQAVPTESPLPREVQQGKVNSPSSPALSDYRELLEFQGRQTEQMLSVQARSFEAAIAASTQSLQSLELIFIIATLLITSSSFIAGWMFKRSIDRMQKTVDESEGLISKQMKDVSALASGLVEFRNQVETVKSEVEGMQDIQSRFERLQDTFRRQEEQIEILTTKTRVALLGLDLHSESREERLRAAEAISEIIKSRSGHAESASFGMALKLFLDCLRRQNQRGEVTREVLYGLQYCADSITRDENVEAINLIISTSRSTETLIRVQALDTLGKIGLWHPDIEGRFWECLENDGNVEVQALAKKMLRETGKLPLED